MRGLDHRKDQSYVLFGITPAALEHTLLPIGGYEKHEVRALAEEMKLPVYNKPDSQEICFVPNQDYAALVSGGRRSAVARGRAGDADGRGRRHAPGAPALHGRPAQGRSAWAAGGAAVRARCRRGGEPRDGRRQGRAAGARRWSARQVNLLGDRGRASGGEMSLHREGSLQPFAAAGAADVTGEDELAAVRRAAERRPGQAVVLYDGDVVLGGGWSAGRSEAAQLTKFHPAATRWRPEGPRNRSALLARDLSDRYRFRRDANRPVGLP